MTKQDKIQEAWTALVGDKYPLLRLDGNGFSDWRCRKLMPNTCWDMLYDKIKSGVKYPFSGGDLIYRPKSLQNIEDNNGWNKIDSRADLPKEEGMYLFLFTNHRQVEQWHEEGISIGGATHWRKIVRIPNPLY